MQYNFNHIIKDMVSKKDGRIFTPREEDIDLVLRRRINYIIAEKKEELDKYDLTYDMKNFKFDESALLAGDETQIIYVISVLKSDYSLMSNKLYKSDIVGLNLKTDGYNYRRNDKLYHIKNPYILRFPFKVIDYILHSDFFIDKEKEPLEVKITETIIDNKTEDEKNVENALKSIEEKSINEDSKIVSKDDILPENIRSIYNELPLSDILGFVSYMYVTRKHTITIDEFVKYNLNLDIYNMINDISSVSSKIKENNGIRDYSGFETEPSTTVPKFFDDFKVFQNYIKQYFDIHGVEALDKAITDFLENSIRLEYRIMLLNTLHELKLKTSLYYSNKYHTIYVNQLTNALKAISINSKVKTHFSLIYNYIKYFNTVDMAFNFLFNCDYFKNLPTELITNDKFKDIVDLLKDSNKFLRAINYYEKDNYRTKDICRVVDECKIKSSGVVSALSEEDAKKHLFDIVAKYYPENEKVIKALLDK